MSDHKDEGDVETVQEKSERAARQLRESMLRGSWGSVPVWRRDDGQSAHWKGR